MEKKRKLKKSNIIFLETQRQKNLNWKKLSKEQQLREIEELEKELLNK